MTRIEIVKLTEKNIADYFDFFDNRAFSDRKGVFCYCTWFHCDCSLEKHYEQGKISMREQTAVLIKSGKFNGYLLYIDDLAIGWCNVGNKKDFMRISSDSFLNYESSEKIKSIVCFEIAPEYRGKGYAYMLLTQAWRDAKFEEYDAIEGYATLHENRTEYNYGGPVKMYEKAEFIEFARKENRVIMKKDLNAVPDTMEFDYFFKRLINNEFINETCFYFTDDTAKTERFLGYIKTSEKPYWVGYCDIPDGADYMTAEELVNAKIYNGKSLIEMWDKIRFISINGLPFDQWISPEKWIKWEMEE